MTAVGTPLYCSPELVGGKPYDEKTDVYSFGVLLLALCVEGSVITFIRERRRQAHGKRTLPTPMATLNAMAHDGWRPLSAWPNATSTKETATQSQPMPPPPGTGVAGEAALHHAATAAAAANSAAGGAGEAAVRRRRSSVALTSCGPLLHAPRSLNDLIAKVT